MYTQCSICETVFKLSPEVLRAAGGQVRCGNCGEVFNALASLAEDASIFTAGESPLDLETRADSILESIGAPQVAQDVAKDYEEYGPPGVEIAHLEVNWSEDDPSQSDAPAAGNTDAQRDAEARQEGDARQDADALQDADEPQDADELPLDDQSMEFTLPPGELDRIFVESKKRPLQTSPPTSPLPQVPRVLQPQAPQQMPSAPPQPNAPPPPPQPQPPQAQALVQPESEQDRILEPEPPPHPERRARFEVPEVPDDVRRDMLEFVEQAMPSLAELRSSPPQRRGFILWLGGAVVAALALSAQIIHRNPDWFAAHIGKYLGAPPPSPPNLSAYQLRQWGVSGDPDATGVLRVRASILNSAPQLQPYPLLRVTLADRFGKGIGSRDFEPAEYVGKPVARMLAPGERVDATLQILDPGKKAEGFEIDVCLRGAAQKLSCANDAAAQSKR